ncbi:unnamed protein product [Linum trigynum]|uniref:Uncharacterized protein n=1 Tax=Linum trigynum TaxID=586398 RepID=A0AAV2GBH1_9ROSI
MVSPPQSSPSSSSLGRLATVESPLETGPASGGEGDDVGLGGGASGGEGKLGEGFVLEIYILGENCT